MSEGPLILAATALLGLSAALRAAEAALFSLDSDQIESLERQGHEKILAVRLLLASREETLTTIRVAAWATNLALAACVLVLSSRALPDHPVLWVAVGGTVSAAAIVLFSDFVARTLGRLFNETASLAFARLLVGLTVLVAPLRWLTVGLSNVLTGSLGESLLEREIQGEEERKTMAPAHDLHVGLEKGERRLISSVVEFGSTQVGEIMTPRPNLFAFPDTTPHDELLGEIRRSKFSRALIYEETLDQISGLLHVKDLLLNPGGDYHEMLRKPLVVPETKRLMDLLREFRRKRVHLAVVCDEFGRTAGVVTMQDLLEEIVGEMADETRHVPEMIRRIGPSEWLVLGRTSIGDLREQTGLALPADMGRTVSGFIATRLGRIPQAGDAISENGFRLTVERMAVRRVAILRVERVEPGAEQEREKLP